MSYVGLGQPAAPGSAVHACSWFQSLLGGYYAANGEYITCAEAAAAVGTVLPNSGPGNSPTLPAQAAVQSIGTNPTPPDGYAAVPLGADSSGTQQYAYVPTAQTQQQVNSLSISDQFGAIDSGSAADNGTTDCSWLDTPGVINNLFNFNCGTPWGLFALLAIAGVMAAGGLRR